MADYKKLHSDTDPACDIIMQDDFVESFVAGAPLIVLNNYLKESKHQHNMKKSSLIPRHHQPRHTDHIPQRKYDNKTNLINLSIKLTLRVYLDSHLSEIILPLM